MSELSEPITFRQLLVRCPRIEVPLIQRDYAQGRETEKDVREEFLKALYDALDRSPEDPGLPLNLDFVYGSMEDGDSATFLPLDGQQRLTTLFLLHWYLAWHDGQHAKFETMLWSGEHSRFTYGVRPSSAEFFDQLVRYVPHDKPDEAPSLRKLVEEQPWFFLHWRLDPTIQSVLGMLDAIHQRFKTKTNLFSRLTDDERPAITFQLLPLTHFGLTDDLYIKMNARGKPLTPFETFKARFEELLKKLFPIEVRELGGGEVRIAEFFERRMDTRWTDFFWIYKDPKTHTFDDQVMNLLLALARASLDPGSPRFSQDTTFLRDRRLAVTFSILHEHGWLTPDFASDFINLLEAWSRDGGQLAPVLPKGPYFDEATFFQKAIREPAALDYTVLVQFAAFIFFLRHRGDGSTQSAKMNEWMRVIRNLAANTDIERPEEYGRCLAGVRKLLPQSLEILKHLSETDVGQIGFSPQQVREEVLKARLILANAGWRLCIERAEEHGYFSGQIEFLLDYCGALGQMEKGLANWDDATHTALQTTFDAYLKKAQKTFTASGLAPIKLTFGPNLWTRALLAIGDYLFPYGSNFSFLTDPHSNGDSWKRFLRGGGSGKRGYLKTLWDHLDHTAEIEPQLKRIISDAADLEPWRAASVRFPDVISYCGEREIRREEYDERIYLLRKRQMNGKHAELFSYVLHLELANDGLHQNLAPLKLQSYQEVSKTELEPHVLLSLDRRGHRMNLSVESEKDQFRVHTSCAELTKLPEVQIALRGQAQFVEEDGELTRLVPRPDIHQVLRQVAESLAGLPN